jgi:hypothetical protein
MPRKSTGAFSQLQQQAKKFLGGIAAEIRLKRAELALLEQQFEQATGIAGLRGRASLSKDARTKAIGRPRKSGGGNSRSSRRSNWTEVLANLPKEFKASDIRKVRGFKDKRASELFAAITRWTDAGTVKKKARGVYIRVK